MSRGQILNAVAEWINADLLDETYLLDDGVIGAGAGYSNVGDNIAQVGGSNGYIQAWEGARDNSSPAKSWAFWLDIISTDYGDADETYVLEIQESDTAAFTVVRKTTQFTLTKADFSAAAIENGKLAVVLMPSYEYVRYNYVCGGTTPNIKPKRGFASPMPN